MLRDGFIWSDAQRIARGVASTNIGHAHIKQRRLSRPVAVAARGMLGDYVPFYFCARSVMLYAIAQGHAGYAGGQDHIVHLVSSVNAAVGCGRPWAFTERHAQLGYAQYFERLDELVEVDWAVMPLTYWAGSADTREKRQAEFLVHQQFPWRAIDRIVVRSLQVAGQVRQILASSSGAHTPLVEVEASWYY